MTEFEQISKVEIMKNPNGDILLKAVGNTSKMICNMVEVKE